MKVYVGTYNKYNNGNLGGEWVDLNDFSSYEEFLDDCKDIHKDEAEPEFMIQDVEEEWSGEKAMFYKNGSVSEEYWEFMEELSKCGIADQVIFEYLSVSGDFEGSAKDMLDGVMENYVGCYNSFEDYADEMKDIPSHIKNYINYDEIKDEYEDEGYMFIEYKDKVYIFY